MAEMDSVNSTETASAAIETPDAPVDASSQWQERISAFAKAIGKSYAEVTQQLVKLVGEANDEGLAALADPDCASNAVIGESFAASVPPVKLSKAIKDLRAAAAPPVVPVPTAARPTTAQSNLSMVALPEAPSDESFLAALRVGGVAKVCATDINAALRVMLAKQVGVYDLPKQLVELMEARAEELDEPVGDNFYALQKQIDEQRYGDILRVMGVPGHFMNESRKKKLLMRMDGLWLLLRNFQGSLEAWQKQWVDRTANPAAMMASLAALLGGGMAAGGIPGMMDHPDISPVMDSASGVIDAFNKMFAGTGIPVARAMAQDSLRIKQVLENPDLPAAVGTSTREEMLKKLGAAVSADYVRLEKDLVTYVLAIMKLASNDIPTEQQPYFIMAMQNRGGAIPWDRLLALKPASTKTNPQDRPPFQKF